MKRILLSLCILSLFSFPQIGRAADPRTNLDLFTGHQWTFSSGAEFPGAKGSFAVVEEEGKKAGKLLHDFTNGGLYVAATSTVQIPGGNEELRFRVKSADWQRIMIRLFDSTGQCHQYELPYADEGDWQLLRIDLLSKAGLSFGGANDKKLHYPINKISIGINQSASTPAGAVYYTDFMLLK